MMKYTGWIRLLAKVFLVGGFLLGIYALEQSNPFLINVSIGLLGFGIAAMASNFYNTLKSRGPDRGPTAWTDPRS